MHTEDQLDAAQMTRLSRKVRKAVKQSERLKSVGHIVRPKDKKRRRKQKH